MNLFKIKLLFIIIMNVNYLSDDENSIEETVQNINRYDQYTSDYVDSNVYDENNQYYEDNENDEDYENEEDYKRVEEEYIKEQNILVLNAINKKSLISDEIVDDELIKSENNKTPKVSKYMSINDLNIKMNKIIEDTQPKKFISKRFLEKKQLDDNNISTKKVIVNIKRMFNPRLPPYFQIHNKN